MTLTRTIPVLDPRTGETEFTITAASADEVRATCASLRQEQHAWQARGIEGRIDVMRRWREEVLRRAEALGERDAADTGGVSTSWSQGFITLANIDGWIDDAAAVLERASVQRPSVTMPHVEVRSQLVPYPLVGVISPWNAPMMLGLLDAIPALFAGSAVIWKPSEVTPRFLEPLFESVRAVPELASVFRFVLGDGETGAAVTGSVDMVCFTGSVPTGRKVAVACAERLIPAYLELGGKDPAIVTSTADLERATTSVLRGAVYATGQVCYSVERVYVHRSIHDAFVDLLREKAERVEFNARDPKQGHLGPFIFAPQAEIVRSHLDDAVAKGAKIVTGGEIERIDGGQYLRPTILTDVDHDMRIMRDETFGPTIPVMAFDTVDEAVRLANDTTFGLTASVLAGDETEALSIAERINAGSVFIQDTFLTFGKSRTIGTNSFGHSGVGGSRTGPESMLRFVRRKALMTNHGDVADIQNDRYGVRQ
ncbi:aldehyde dehydrogenase [Pseudoclavibacter endophyticus]|nr:aldehyde dehydrogenase family protein [Pseudoclavibacter endophyticus]GGA66425.1 aldehyde dehydrogenase [Pseudoclavibacter endophyticus]